jgi:hypothetical protein
VSEEEDGPIRGALGFRDLLRRIQRQFENTRDCVIHIDGIVLAHSNDSLACHSHVRETSRIGLDGPENWSPGGRDVLEDEACCVVQSSPQDEWFSKNRNRRMEVSGDRGKAVWYMCWADSWIGRKKWRVNRRQSLVRSCREYL